jgi:hypothetical protein
MRRSKLGLMLFIALVVITVAVICVHFAIAPTSAGGTDSPDVPNEAPSNEALSTLCKSSNFTDEFCADLVRYASSTDGIQKFNDAVSTCGTSTSSQECIRENMTANSMFQELIPQDRSLLRVYPQNYRSVTLSVDDKLIVKGQDNSLVLEGTGVPLVMRFVLEADNQYSIQTADATEAVYVGTDNALSLESIGLLKSSARFDVRGTAAGDSATVAVAPLTDKDGKLYFTRRPETPLSVRSVSMRLRQVNNQYVDVYKDPGMLSDLQWAANRAVIKVTNNAGCCITTWSQNDAKVCTDTMRARYPLCCANCKDEGTWCVWKTPIDAGITDTECCLTWSMLPNQAEDYDVCNGPNQYTRYDQKCDPPDELTFGRVPPGVWTLAPDGVRLPAYGRVAQMRLVSAGYRGDQCKLTK